MEYLPREHTDYMKQLALKKDTAVAVITAGLRADENRFRRRQHDIIAKIFARATADKKLSPIIDQPSYSPT
jgi:hypothetical protein